MREGIPVGLVGCGRWGRHILRDLVSLGCRVTVVARSRASRDRATEGGAHELVETVEELAGLAGIVVATPTDVHADTVQAALEHRVPVVVEKPLTNSLASAKALVAAGGDRLFVMDKWRYHPGVELLAELARTAELGPVIGLRTTRIGWGNPHEVDSVWILVPHDLAIGLEILGNVSEARTAVADAVDGAAEGMVALLGERPWQAIEVSARSPERRREVTLVCEQGVAFLADGYSDRVIVRTGEDRVEERSISTELPLLRELRAFVGHLDGGPPPRSSAAEGLTIVRRIAELRSLAGLPE
jgi:predicted dehydrogenase